MVLAAILDFAVLHVVVLANAQSIYFDITQEYVLAKALVSGVDPYTPMYVLAARWLPEGMGRLAHPTPHPVFVGWLSLPLAGLTFLQAARTWLVLEILGLAVGVWLFARIARGTLRLRWVALLTFGLIGWYPVAMELHYGQLSVALTLLFLGSWWALQRGRDEVAGVCLGLTVLLKFTGMPVLLYLLLKGRGRAVASAAALVIWAHLLAVWIHGWPMLVRYYAEVGPAVFAEYRDSPGNHSAWLLGGVWLPVALLAAMLWATRSTRMETSLPFLFGAGLFLSPLVWMHYFVMALPALGVLGLRLHAAQWPRWPTGIALTAMAVTMAGVVPYRPAQVLAMGSLLGLLLWTDFEAHAARHQYVP